MLQRQTATALSGCPALLSSHAKDTMSLVQLSIAHSSNANWGHANEHPHGHDQMMLQCRHCKSWLQLRPCLPYLVRD